MTTNLPAPAGVHRFSVAHFLIALVVLLVTAPFVEQLTNGDLIEAVLITLVLLSAVLAVGGRRGTLIIAAVMVTPAVVGTWLDHFWPGLFSREVTLVASIVFVAFVIVRVLGFILRASWVNAEVLCAAVATYLMLAIFWAFAYTLVARVVPDSFVFTVRAAPNRSMARFEALYFSLGTLTTVDYGDIIPVSNAARMLAVMEATTGVLYVAVLIARLVALYSSNQPARSNGAPNSPPTANADRSD
jgi:hypothetical protein